jgi:hypothetical protein
VGRDGLVVPWQGQRNVGEGWIGRADGEDHDALFMGFISDSVSIPLLVFIESMLIKNSSKLGRANHSPMFRDLASGVNYPVKKRAKSTTLDECKHVID